MTQARKPWAPVCLASAAVIALAAAVSAAAWPQNAPEARTAPYPRSLEARRAFQNTHPCPSTGRRWGHCPGWIVDHIEALACGGPDTPANMQWQTTADAAAKDKWERRGCAYGRRFAR